MRRLGIIAAIMLALAGVARAEILVTVSKSDQQLAVAINGVPTYRWQVSTGKPGRETPVGSYKAIRLERVYYSQKFDSAPMPNSVFFHGGYAIHGTNEVDKLGRPVSQGCVRLTRANAETLFNLVKAQGMSATRIVIKDGPLGGAIASSERLPVMKVAGQDFRPREERDVPRRDSRAEPPPEPRYDPRLSPYSERRDPRDERAPYSAPRDPRDEPQNFSRPRFDPREDQRNDQRMREPPRERRNTAREDNRRDYRDAPRDRRAERQIDRNDPRYDRRAPRYRDERETRRYSERGEPRRYEERRGPPPSSGRVQLLREYERLARRQAEIERELMRSRGRTLPPERYRAPPRDRYSGPPPRERGARDGDRRERDLRDRERDREEPRDFERRPPREPTRYRERYSAAEAR